MLTFSPQLAGSGLVIDGALTAGSRFCVLTEARLRTFRIAAGSHSSDPIFGALGPWLGRNMMALRQK
jgi:hypothetical protein